MHAHFVIQVVRLLSLYAAATGSSPPRFWSAARPSTMDLAATAHALGATTHIPCPYHGHVVPGGHGEVAVCGLDLNQCAIRGWSPVGIVRKASNDGWSCRICSSVKQLTDTRSIESHYTSSTHQGSLRWWLTCGHYRLRPGVITDASQLAHLAHPDCCKRYMHLIRIFVAAGFLRLVL